MTGAKVLAFIGSSELLRRPPIERLMTSQALRVLPRRREPPKDESVCLVAVIAPHQLNRQFAAERPNHRWIADFTYIWTADGWILC